MAIYNNLPVYKTSYDFLVDIFNYAKNFSQEYKYTIGESIKGDHRLNYKYLSRKQ